jgi:hypothetical protein
VADFKRSGLFVAMRIILRRFFLFSNFPQAFQKLFAFVRRFGSVARLICQIPLALDWEFCKESAQPLSCLEMPSASDFKFEISDLRSANAGSRSKKHSRDRTSPDEPRAMYRNVKSSCVVPRSNPSAILFETETAARSIWSRRPEWRPNPRFPANV